MKTVLKDLGELRTTLVATAILTILFVPLTTDRDVRMEGFGLFPDVLAPVLASILVFGLLLDMLMSRVFLGTLGEEKGGRFRTIIRVEAVTLVVMVVSWIPYFNRMLL